jgi:tetratricopeptide (TPR) repeat protein
MITIKSTKALFASGQTETALQQLMELTSNAPKETHQSAILLRSAWEFQERETINGTLSFEEANTQRNRITQGALDLIDDYESEGAITNSTQSGIQQDLWNSQTAALMQVYDNDQTSIQRSTIHANSDANVIIGAGNTINKTKISGFGMRQFATILIVLGVVLGGGYWAYETLFKGQDKAYASLSDIQKELGTLADLNGSLRSILEKDRKEIDTQLAKGMKAMQDKDYKTALQYLETVAEKTPASTVYQNIAFAYEQIGKQDKASAAMVKAKEINPNLEAGKSMAQLKGKTINVLSPENGGKILVTTQPENSKWVDNDEQSYIHQSYDSNWAVFEFKDGAKVKINEFRVLIPRTENSNPKSIVISYNNDSPTGNFVLIDTIKPLNAFLPESPFQKFSISPIKAKFIKIEVVGRWTNIYELQLMGTIE